MGDVKSIVRGLGLGAAGSNVEFKANELFRLSIAKLGPATLGSSEIARSAVCVDLACMMLHIPTDLSLLARRSGLARQAYMKARLLLQRGLDICQGTTPRELCIQFGCARLEPLVRSSLSLYKQRFIERLSEQDRTRVDFSRPVFLASAFWLVARHNRVKIARQKIIHSLGIGARELSEVIDGMADVLSDCFPSDEASKIGRKGNAKRQRASLDDITNHIDSAQEEKDVERFESETENVDMQHSWKERPDLIEEERQCPCTTADAKSDALDQAGGIVRTESPKRKTKASSRRNSSGTRRNIQTRRRTRSLPAQTRLEFAVPQ